MPRRVLIVDDCSANRKTLQQILSAQYEVLQAGNGREALEQVHRGDIRLSAILLNLMIQAVDGYTFLKQLRSEPAFAALPVIVATGESGEEAEVLALHCGATNFLSKPYRSEVILAQLENLIRLRESAVGTAPEWDRLTGLLNQEGFYGHALQMLQQQSTDILMLDICNFKLVNDLYGDHAGDELLQATARKLRQEVAVSGALLARKTGSNQFLMMVPRDTVDPQMLWRRMDRWLNAYPLDRTLPLRVGVYHAENDGTPVSVMCDNAKLAADSVRDRFDVRTAVYTTDMRKDLLSKQEMVDDLERALRERQFEAWYQPKCDPITGKLVGAEALVRWNHPVRGVVLPKDFIPMMERNRLIIKLDRAMWKMVCRDLSDWIRRGRSVVPVSVNVSRVDMSDRHLAQRLQELVRRYELDPALLPLEITESAYAEDPNQLMAAVQDLRKRDFCIEIDDFGAGYSSLNMLTEVPVDGVKLDMRFMQRFHKAGRNGEMVRHLMEMIGCLGLNVTAEGVETRDQISFLRELHCPVVQGRYYAGPMPREKFEEFMDTHL